MTNTLLEVKGLNKIFELPGGVFQKKRELHAVHDVSFEILEGKTFSLVGESGCGKSTTGRLISRLLDSNQGEIWIDGEEVSHLKEAQLKQMRKKVQMIFQDPYASLNPRMKVRDIIAEPLVIHTKLSAKEREMKVLEMLDVVGLNEYHSNLYAHEFSGGQRQRIGIAKALIMKPKLIIADEPVSALDVSIQSQILNLLKELQTEYQLTYLFISHDLSVVEYISDYIGVMYLGTIVETGPREVIFSNPQHPYTQALLSSVPIPDPTLRKKRTILKGDIPSPVNPPSGCKFHTRCPSCMEICKVTVPVPRKGIVNDHIVSCHLIK